MFGFLDMDSKLAALTDSLSLHSTATHILIVNDTLKNKTVVRDLIPFCLLQYAFPCVSVLFCFRFELLALFTFVNRTISVTIFISATIDCCWSRHNSMLFLDDLLGNSSPNEDPLGASYIHNPDRALTLVNSKMRISRQSLGSVFYCCFEYRKKLNDSVWIRVASIWGVSRYVNGSAVCLMFEASFARKFASYLLYGGFSKIGIDSFDWFVRRCDFDPVAFTCLKNEVLKFDFHRSKDRISSVIAFKDLNDPMPPPVSIDAKLFIDSVWFERWLRLQRELPGCSTKIWDADMLRRWGRKLYKPWELDARVISTVALVTRPVNHFRSQVSFGDWTFHDWAEFFDLISGEDGVIGIDVIVANLRKGAYGFPVSWSPSKLVSYCREFKLAPLGYPDNVHVALPAVAEAPFQLDSTRVEELKSFSVELVEGKSIQDALIRCGSDAFPTAEEKTPVLLKDSLDTPVTE
jgi:hypothetical protein